ncbi:MAG: diguanylate cyclase [Campylobacterota bacterium]|nr:diguanylate cyclase [Campylobacterota bacterium]
MKKILNLSYWHFILLFLLSMLFAGYAYYSYSKNLHAYKKNSHKELQLQLQSILFSYTLLAEHLYSHVDEPGVYFLINQAAKSKDAKVQGDLRDHLYHKLLPLYKKLQEQHIRQLHFHLPGAISFLRFHRPNKFGDSLLDIRPSIAKINQDYQERSGFEEGRIFNGFRHLYPIFFEDKFVGSFEIAFSFAGLKDSMMKLYPASYRLLIDKTVVDTKVFTEEQENYQLSDISSKYLYDKATLHTPNRLSSDTINALNGQLKGKIEAQLKEKRFFSHFLKVSNTSYLVSFIPLENISAKKVGYYVIYKEDATKENMLQSLYLQLINISVFTLILSVLLLLYRRYLTLISLAQEQREASQRDALTQIANRAFFQAQAPLLIGKSIERDKNLSIIFFDIDHFKNINDTFGHNTGDIVLQEIAKVVQHEIRQEDFFSRWGGEEFVIILSNVNRDHAQKIAEKIRLAIEIYDFSHVDTITCSFGVAQLTQSDTLVTLIERADIALYEAKNSGRNCVKVN